MYRKQVRRRRAVLLLLVAASLTLLSLYYREGNAGPLHGAQNVVSTIFSPISSVTDRALKPVRDLVNWFDETFDARGDKARLQDQVATLRDQLARQQTQQGEAKELSALNELTSGGIVPDGTTPVTARVVGRSPTVWYSTVTIDQRLERRHPGRRPGGRRAGPGREDHPDDPEHRPGHADHRRRQRRHGPGAAERRDRRRRAQRRQPQRPPARLPGARRRRSRRGRWSSRRGSRPATWVRSSRPGIPIGKITRATVEEQQAYQRVHLSPFADLRDMDFVKVLTTHSGGGSK